MAEDFNEKLIKGRIAETVFERMFREQTKFDIYPLGYEYTLPILQQVKDEISHNEKKAVIQKILENFDDSPDYLLVKPDKSEVYTVEVKYLQEFNLERIVKDALSINERWHLTWLFVATKDGFYFDTCNKIVEYNKIHPLDWVSITNQQKYLKLIQEFEK